MKPTIKNLADRPVAYLSYTGNYMGNPEIFKQLFQKLGGWAVQKQIITPDTVFLSSYQDNPQVTPPDELTLEACVHIPENTEVEGDIQKKVLPGGEYAVINATLTNPEEYGQIWNDIVNWAMSNNFKIDMSRPSYEIYLNNPEEDPQKRHIVDICLSVKKIENMCQSCGMPLENSNEEYCQFCYQDGKFTFNGTYEEFVEHQVAIAKEKIGIPEDQAREMAKKILPNLKRWKDQ